MLCDGILAEACDEIREIEARIKRVERQLEATAEQLPAVAWLFTIPGVGILTATALVAFLGDIRRFPFGPTPGQLPRPHAARSSPVASSVASVASRNAATATCARS